MIPEQLEDPQAWATRQHNFGEAWRTRQEGDAAQNIEQAIGCFEQALTVFTAAEFPRGHGLAQNSLGAAYLQRQLGERADNIEQALLHLGAALAVRPRERYPLWFAKTHANIASAWHQRSHAGGDPADRAASLAQAISHLETALAVQPDGLAGTLRDQVQEQLARARHERDACEPGPAPAAVNATPQPAACTTPPPPVARGEALAARATEHLLRHEWQAALDVYDQAILQGDAALAAAGTSSARLDEIDAGSRLYSRSAWCLLQLGRPEQALLRVDAGRTRLLTAQFAASDADLALLPAELAQRLRAARHELRSLASETQVPEQDLPQPGPIDLALLSEAFPQAPQETVDGGSLHRLTLRQARTALAGHGLRLDLTPRLHEAQARLRELMDEARSAHPGFAPAGMAPQALLALIPPGGAIVAFLLGALGSVAWVVPDGAAAVDSSHVLGLAPGVATELNALLSGPEGDGGWLAAYLAASRETGDDSSGHAGAAWQQAIEQVTQALWHALMGPVHERLAALGLGAGSEVLLMPHGALALLPLPAAWRLVDGQRRSFLDDHAVTWAPSLHTAALARRRLAEPTRQGRALLAVVDPDGDLPYAAIEGQALASCFGPAAAQVLAGPQATEDEVLRRLPSASHLHFATHGEYDWREVMHASLALAAGTRLTLARVVSPEVDLSHTRLVVLSACETGLTEFQQAPDEFLGLPAGFLEGGAPGVISALWQVNDLSTGLLMQAFYRRHIGEGQPVARALQGAQCWLRDASIAQLGLAQHWEARYRASDPPDPQAYRMMRYCLAQPDARPYASPYHWAAFTFSGA